MADILNTATGTVLGDVSQIRNAIFGREVRASIAEAIELLYDGQTITVEGAEEPVSLKEKVDSLETSLSGVLYIGIYREYTATEDTFSNALLMHFADGTTSKDRAAELANQQFIYKGHRYTFNSDGTLTPWGESGCNGNLEPLNCGYSTITKAGSEEASKIILYDENHMAITTDSDGEREQACILYGSNYGVTGFVLEDKSKLHISELIERISALEAEISALKGE